MSTYSGRLGKICDRIRWEANLGSDSAMASEAQLLDLVNQCQQDLTRSRYYRRETVIDVVAGTDTIDLFEVVPDLYELYGLFWLENKRRLWEIQTDADAKSARLYLDDGTPQAYYIRGNDLQLIPAPLASASDAIAILYHYAPDDLTGLTAAVPDGTTPEGVLPTDDELFVLYALAKIYARDRHAPLAQKLSMQYEAKYESMKRRTGSRNQRAGRILPYR